MEKTLEWTWTDGWILMSLFMTRQPEGTPLQNIIAAADAINHAIPTPKELSSAFTKLIQVEIVSERDSVFSILPEYLSEIQRAYDRRGGLFKTPEKGYKWLKKAQLSIKNGKIITEKQIISALA